MTKVPTELARALRQVRIYDKKEVNRAFASLKEENERLNARVAELTAPDAQGEVGEGVPDARWLLDQYEAFIAAIPVGQENKTRGASAYNWHRAAKATLESLLGAAQIAEQKPACPTCLGRGWDIACQYEFHPTTCPDCAGSGKAEHSITVQESDVARRLEVIDRLGPKIRERLADGEIDLREAVEELNQLYAGPTPD